jgi:hypothetical protein
LPENEPSLDRYDYPASPAVTARIADHPLSKLGVGGRPCFHVLHLCTNNRHGLNCELCCPTSGRTGCVANYGDKISLVFKTLKNKVGIHRRPTPTSADK